MWFDKYKFLVLLGSLKRLSESTIISFLERYSTGGINIIQDVSHRGCFHLCFVCLCVHTRIIQDVCVCVFVCVRAHNFISIVY